MPRADRNPDRACLSPPAAGAYGAQAQRKHRILLDKAREPIEVELAFGGGYNRNAGRLTQAEISNGHGQGAVDRLFHDLELEEKFGVSEGTDSSKVALARTIEASCRQAMVALPGHRGAGLRHCGPPATGAQRCTPCMARLCPTTQGSDARAGGSAATH